MKLEHMLKEVLVSEGAACRFMEPMSSHTTFRIGGPAEAYVCPVSYTHLTLPTIA